MKKVINRLKYYSKVTIFILLSNVLLIVAGLLPDSLQGENVFRGMFYIYVTEHAVLYNSLTLVIIMIFIFVLFYLNRGFIIPFVTLSRDKVQPHKCLILPISPITHCIPEINGNTISFKEKEIESFVVDNKDEENLLEFINYIQKLTDDNKIKQWPWQQLLRGIRPHYNTVEKIYLLGSKNKKTTKGSFEQLPLAKSLINAFFNKNTDFIINVERDIDFEDDSELRYEMTKIINKLRKTYSERDIVIDVTGGMKPTSIAGAIVTLNTKVTFQYVQTLDEKDVIGYDVITVLKSTME